MGETFKEKLAYKPVEWAEGFHEHNLAPGPVQASARQLDARRQVGGGGAGAVRMHNLLQTNM
jgi:hypothetical protein